MISLKQIHSTIERMRPHADSITKKKADLDASTEIIRKDLTRHPDYVKDKIAEARGKAVSEAFDILGTITAEHEKLNSQERFWGNKNFIASTKPLSSNANDESMARLAKMIELSIMDNDLLQLHFENAKAKKNYGLVHLLMLANSGRDPKSLNWKPMDAKDFVLEDQDRALALFEEARKIVSFSTVRLSRF